MTTEPAGEKIKVLFFCPSEFLGPVWTVYTHIIRHLDRDRFIPYVVLNSQARGTVGLRDDEAIIIRRWPFGQSLRGTPSAAFRAAIELPTSLLALARYARKEGIAIVQCIPSPRIGAMGYILARLIGARLLLHYHGVPAQHGLRRTIEWGLARRADRAVGVSQFIAGHIRRTGIAPAKVAAVVNGADTARFNPANDGSGVRREFGIAPDEPLIVQLGRIHQGKRQEDTVRAFVLAHERVPALRCLLVGWEDPDYTGPFPGYKAELLDIAARANLGDHLRFADARPDAPAILAAADMTVMPSLDDACPLAVIEAMAAGKPVIGADSGGVTELIADGVTGYHVPPKSPAVLAERMVTLATDPALRQAMNQAARARAERHFAEPRLAAEFGTIYEAMVADPHALADAVALQPSRET